MPDIPRCYEPKHGRVDLTCELDDGHDGWHKATYTDHQEVVYQGAHHDIHLTETVTWEGFKPQLNAALRRVTDARKEDHHDA